MTIDANTKLASLEGLSLLTHAGGLTVRGNPKLANLKGLEALASLAGSLAIREQPSLTDLQN